MSTARRVQANVSYVLWHLKFPNARFYCNKLEDLEGAPTKIYL